MKRLNLLAVIILLLLTQTSHAQTYTLLTTDAAGDETQNVQDISKISYRINTAKDSIWFKIETHSQMLASSHIGFMFGLDTNLVGTTGQAWSGTNTSMKYDHALFVYQNGLMEPGVVHADIGTLASPMPCSVSIQRPDNKTMIVGMKMAVLDPNGDFNMIVGSGFSDVQSTGTTFDDAPETTVLQIRKPTTSVPTVTKRDAFTVYPNPATHTIRWEYKGNTTTDALLTDITGKVLANVPAATQQLDIRAYQPGVYLLKIGDATTRIVKE